MALDMVFLHCNRTVTKAEVLLYRVIFCPVPVVIQVSLRRHFRKMLSPAAQDYLMLLYSTIPILPSIIT